MLRSIQPFFILSVIVLLVWFFYDHCQEVISVSPNAWVQDHKGDCAVVLTGGPGRVKEGFGLLTQKQVRKLIITGVHPSATLREIFPQWPVYGQLLESDVILERRSQTTYGNAQQTLPLVEALGCKEIILITSTLHMHRALKTFKAIFPRDFVIHPRAILAGSLDPDIWDAINETIKTVFYGIWVY